MALTLSDIVTRTRDLLGEASDGSFWDDNEIKRAINDSLDELSQKLLLPINTSGTIAANDTTLAMPSDFVELQTFVVNERIMTEISPRELYLKNRTLDDTGQPVVFWWDFVSATGARRVRLYPQADTSYTYRLFYFKELPDLINDTDSPIFDSRWHFILMYGAAWRMWIKMGRRTDLADGFRSVWEEYKAKCWQDLLISRNQDILVRPIEPLAPRPVVANDPLNWP